MKQMEYKLVQPIRFVKQDEALYLVIQNSKIRVPSELESQIDFGGGMAVVGTYFTECGFKIRRKKNDFFIDKRTLSLMGHNFKIADKTIEVSGLELYRYDEKDVFCSTLQDILNEKIVAHEQAFDDYILELLDNENVPWSEEEEKVALRIYLETKGHPYSDQLAATQIAIESGELRRSAPSIEMKINCYKALDSDSDVAGLTNTGVNAKKTWEDYKNAQNH